MAYKKDHIERFLLSRGWERFRSGELFEYYKPPSLLNLNQFELEVANNENKAGFQNYTTSLIDIIFDIYNEKISLSDLQTFFTSDSTVLSFRIIDEDTKSGSIQFERLSKAIDNLKLVFKQTVTFIMSDKPIFGESKNIAESYIKHCRALQTEVGSFVTKVQLPAHPIHNIIENLDSTKVPGKLFKVLDFTEKEILQPKIALNRLDKNYLESNKDYINIELLTAIKDLCYQSSLNNFEFKFESFDYINNIAFESIKPNLAYFNNYIKQLKNILLESSPLEFIGAITKLASNSPKQSNNNEIIIEGEIANKKERVKVILNRQDYNNAIEAHKNELKVKVMGYAKQSSTQYIIDQPELFEVIQ